MTDHIPTKFAVFAEAVAKLAAQAGFSSVILNIRDGWNPTTDTHWPADVRVSWQDGRHGEAARRLTIESTVVVRHSFQDRPHD